jgi:hypothetical protein
MVVTSVLIRDLVDRHALNLTIAERGLGKEK